MKKLTIISKGYIIKKDYLLLVQRSNNDKINPGKWTNPGGKIEKGENPENACIREIKEETNLDVNIKKFINIKSFKSFFNETQVVIFEFECEIINKSQKIILNKEHQNYKWIKKEKFNPKKIEGETSLW